jgi:hypothetical protein
MSLERMRDLMKASMGRSLDALREEDKLAVAWGMGRGGGWPLVGTIKKHARTARRRDDTNHRGSSERDTL